MTAPATTSPEGTNADSESLSNWGSVDENCETLSRNRARRAEVIQQRRQAGGSTNTARRTTAPSSTMRSDARRVSSSKSATASSLRSTKRAGGGEREGAAVRLNNNNKTNGITPTPTKNKATAAAAPTSSKGKRAGSLERPTVSSSQERPSAVGATARRSRKRLSVEKNGANKPRSSLGSVGGQRSSLGSRRGAEEDDHQQELREIVDLDAAAPSQEEIRLMIDRIRREAAGDGVVGGRAASGKKASRFEHEVRTTYILVLYCR